MKRIPLLAALAGALWLALVAGLSAQTPEAQVKAEFLERFARFIDWPDSLERSDPSTPFVIGIVGRDPFGSAIDRMASTRKIHGRRIEVRRFVRSDIVTGAWILFIARSEAPNLREILSRTDGRPVLTVGDSGGFAERGVLVNLVIVEGSVSFEVNEDALRRSGLSASSKLLKNARIVDGGHR